jgi:hypothetical protein
VARYVVGPMANLSDDDTGISLEPMFNILACTLGFLVFVVAIMSTVSVGTDRAVEFVAPEFPEEMQRESPTWIEWNGRDMVLHPTADSVVFERDLRAIPTFEDTYDYMFERLAGTRLGSALADASLESGRYVIMFVRPAGFQTITEVRGYLQLLGIDLVEVPLDDSWARIRVQ